MEGKGDAFKSLHAPPTTLLQAWHILDLSLPGQIYRKNYKQALRAVSSAPHSPTSGPAQGSACPAHEK